jgi:HSP20 family protein
VQTEDAVKVHADLPGLKKEEITVDINNNVLTRKVDREEKQEESQAADPEKEGSTIFHCSERSRVSVTRSVKLPEAADTAAGKASYTDGVLST